MAEQRTLPAETAIHHPHEAAISLARKVLREFQLTDLQPLLKAVERRAKNQFLNVAIFGRFKAGKSSFLNCLLGRAILPVGVVPVTSVVTEICYAPAESAEVLFQQNRRIEQVPLDRISAYISESQNPENRLGVETVRAFVPEMEPYKLLRLVDTPGLDSILGHNSEMSLAWSPNTDLALVAVGVDPPLTQQDIALIERLLRFTPNVSILLTKMDILTPAEQQEVLYFVTSRLQAKFHRGLRLFPFSIKPGYEILCETFRREYLSQAVSSFQGEHSAALVRTLCTLLSSAADYLQLALMSAKANEQDRAQLRQQVLGSEDVLADTKLQFRLFAKNAAARTRPIIERHLQKTARAPLQSFLEERLREEFPGWQGSFARLLEQFEDWMRSQLLGKLSAISAANRPAFLQPWEEMQRQCRAILQSFRDQLSEKVSRLFGISLRTSEIEIELQPPRAPDIHLSRVFDHNWELLSPVIPVRLFRGVLERRFQEKIESEVFKNLSRLTAQWEESVHAAIRSAESEAVHRFDELLLTVQRLLSMESSGRSDSIQDYLRQLRARAESLSDSRIAPPQP